MGQRITRAKAKIKAARIPYRVPSAEDLPARVGGVLAVGADAPHRGPPHRPGFGERRHRLAGYHAYHATRADLLRRLGRSQKSRAAYDNAIELAATPPRLLT